MRVDLLCSGSKGNSCLVRDGQTQILIDCGSTKKYLMNALKSVNQKVDDLNGVLITHTHKDHISQIKHFSHLPMYSWCDLDVDDHHTVLPLQEFDIGTFHIKVIQLSHDAPKTAGFVIWSGDQKLVYITDTGYIPNGEKQFLENADTYIFESNHEPEMLMRTSRPMFVKQRILGDNGHLCNRDSGANLSQVVNSRTKNIVLAHISEEGNDPHLALDTLHNVFLQKDLNLRGIHTISAPQFEVVTIKDLTR
jgi:phosphoribosyl 1,2-cyclic phosphodiesterase